MAHAQQRHQRSRACVALGIISKPKELVMIEIAVILLTAQAFAINRITGIPYPLWSGAAPPVHSSN
jgi:CBS domain-containing membrane protein